MRLFKIGLLVAALAGAFASGYIVRATRPVGTASARKVLYYVDPMHPAYRSDKPGVAPDCGMTLEPVYADEPASAVGTAGRTALYYRDPAQPDYKSDKPGLNPETGNTLEPVYAEASIPPGAVRISPDRQQIIGVKFAVVERGTPTRTVRAVGKVAADETRIGHVHTRIEGWIEQVFVNFTGDIVGKGDPMLTIYSPEMLASQQELLLASRARDLMKSNPLASAADHGQSLFDAAKRRLELWDLSEDQIQQVLQTGRAIRSITVHAPMAGFVTERNAFPNQKVTPESDLYTITDLSHVWIIADVFESDITAIKTGDLAYVSFANAGAPSLGAKVEYIQPQVDPMTRTLKVRLGAHNPGLRMKPEMFVNVEFGVAGAPQLTVPSEAVLNSGDRQTVFVDLGNGYLQPRQVTVGEQFGDRVAITGGLAAGERVVSSGTFLVDSESQLKAAASGMGAALHQHGTAGAPSAKPASTAAATPAARRGATTPPASSPHEGHRRD